MIQHKQFSKSLNFFSLIDFVVGIKLFIFPLLVQYNINANNTWKDPI